MFNYCVLNTVKTMNNIAKLLCLLFLIGFQNISCQTYDGKQEDIDQILKNIEAFSDFYINADYESLANAYAEDAVILPPGDDIIKGQEAIKEKWQLPEGFSILDHKISPTEIKIEGNYAYDIGYYSGSTQKKDGSQVSWKGKYLIVWVRRKDDWKIYADAWNRID